MSNSRTKTIPKGGSFCSNSLDELGVRLGANKLIYRLLIANNGLAAVKGIDSIKAWLYEHIGDADAIHFAVMATPEDLQANAEFISMSDQHFPVPGGPNYNNYGNVDVIMRCAAQHSCDAIYPGWGHASENPALPRECKRSSNIVFLGPSEEAMFALGDKIASTIVAQSNGVPTVPWSGDSIMLRPGVFEVNTSDYEKAYITTADECEEVCRRIGFPVMIKASEGGGGKGIRCCNSLDLVKNMFFAVSEEVKGCHIFAMRMLENIRHLEVQLLADAYGNVIAIGTRDCSVQRRHQKLIEEGPAYEVDPKVIASMEEAAVRMAKVVQYRGLGTVEFMYDKTTQKFFFLELNPRIQVEHPVSEMLSGINLPAALLCVGMGIRLDRIPEVRVFFGEEPYGTTPIDFENGAHIPLKGHVIAVRITAEDTEESFRPSSGTVEEIHFKNSKECWGYFSVSSGGSIHQFADSQFGHIFSSGATREDARRGMILALRNLMICGEIRTSTSYVLKLLQTPAFSDGNINTSWLDRLLSQKSVEPPDSEAVYNALVSACIFRCYHHQRGMMERYSSHLEAGHVPSTELLSNYRSEAYVRHRDKYVVSCGLVSEFEMALCLNESVVIVPFRILKSGALQLTIGEKTMVSYVAEEPNGLRVTIGGKTINFSGALDPTKLMASVPGRMVRYLIEDGGHIGEGGAFAEVEVMKMILPLRASIGGILHHRVPPGTSIAVGMLLAEITPDDEREVTLPTVVSEKWPSNFLEKRFERPDGLARSRRGIENLHNLILGYHFSALPMEQRISDSFSDFLCLSLSSVSLPALNIPFISVEEHATAPSTKIKVVLSALLKVYLENESHFNRRSREDAISQMRDSGIASGQIYRMDFAHSQPSHEEAVMGILRYLEKNHALLKLLENELAQLSFLKPSLQSSIPLSAKYLLRQSKLPSFLERKTEFAKELEHGEMSALIKSSFGYDLMCSIMFDRQYTHLIQVCLELFVRRECSGECNVTSLDIFSVEKCWFSIFSCDEENPSASVMEGMQQEKPSGSTSFLEMGACAVFMDEKGFNMFFKESFEKVLFPSAPKTSYATVFFSVSRASTQTGVLEVITHVLTANRSALTRFSNLDTLYFVIYGMPDGPHFFTFALEHGQFIENALLRNVRRQLSRRLELDRLSNYEVEMQPTPYKDVHLFKGVPKKKKSLPIENRIFARVVVTANDMNMKKWTEATDEDIGHMLTKCTAALEVARDRFGPKYPKSNHIFVKMVEITFDVGTLHSMILSSAAAFSDRLTGLGVTDVEVSFQAKVRTGLIQMRALVDSPSRYDVNAHVYYETICDDQIFLSRAEFSEDVQLEDDGSQVLDWHSPTSLHNGSLCGGMTSGLYERSRSMIASLRDLLPSKRSASEVSNELHPQDAVNKDEPSRILFEPYPLLDNVAIRRLQAHANGTTYVNDWPTLFKYAVDNEWASLCSKRGLSSAILPPSLVATPLLTSAKNTLRVTTDKNLAVVAECGILAWLVTFYSALYWSPETQSCPPRSFVLVANDITHSAGSFSVPENNLFKASCALAREKHIPFIYVSSNSGARIGLCDASMEKFLVDFTSKGEFNYIYFTEKDYEELCKKNIVLDVKKKVLESGEVRYVLQGVSGSPDAFLGVENLSGSGLMAGEMSRCYSEIPTMSIVSGRSVGIGAYLNRLGRRIIQVEDSPMILTGYKALNRLLGKDVYANNSQLGGKKIMAPNGTTHFSTKHDYASVRVAVRWLNFLPDVCDMQRCNPRALTLPIPDPIDRDVTFMPVADVPYDPRYLVRGYGAGEITGLFDSNSWMETMEEYAKTVVTGRATLGGIPCGVVLVETRHIKKHNPADPADPASASSFIVQAGQVWYSDSARKTAEAIEDFHHERLPIFIIANWRGFSGGSRDMFDEILKFGSTIVDNLRVCNTPVFIYIPPFGELRGGAWVVIDTKVNSNRVVEMYCDPTSRGGVLEASGIAEIKFRRDDVSKLIRRCHPDLESMPSVESRAEEERLWPRYSDAAVRFADLHDTHFRMEQVGVIKGVIPWVHSRRMFYAKLKRKLKEIELANAYVDMGEARQLEDGMAIVKTKVLSGTPQSFSSSSDVGDAASAISHDMSQLEKLEKELKVLEKKSTKKPGLARESFEGGVNDVANPASSILGLEESGLSKIFSLLEGKNESELENSFRALFKANSSLASAAAKALDGKLKKKS